MLKRRFSGTLAAAALGVVASGGLDPGLRPESSSSVPAAGDADRCAQRWVQRVCQVRHERAYGGSGPGS
jgi:hypothetical protein